MARPRIILLIIGVVRIVQAAPAWACPTTGAAQSVVAGMPICTGKFKGYLKPSTAELAEILKQHAAWWKDGGYYNPGLANDPRRANLCEANLSGANLANANLSYANLVGADLADAKMARSFLNVANLVHAFLGKTDLRGASLVQANLTNALMELTHLDGAGLTGANLVGANLFRAYLADADLSFAHLTGAFLGDADMTGTHLVSADLTGADLVGADLTGAILTNAYLAGAKLNYVNLTGAYLDFDPNSPPKPVPDTYNVKNLQFVKFGDQSAGLFKLRAEFKDLGMRLQESQLTYAIRRSETNRKNWSERYFNLVFFDWTCQYGMAPGRPLSIVAAIAVMLSVVYIFAQVDPGSSGGIWAVWDERRINQNEGSGEPLQLTDGFPSGRSQISFLLLALYFSLLSAVRIGWHELNVGTWITRIQPRQYSLQATGWVRVVSGVQSLISVYLVALAILTYFGTPFEY